MKKLPALAIVFFGVGLYLNAQTAAALEWRIALKPTPQYASAKAKAKYKDIGGEREFEVEAQNLWTLRSTALRVYVNGAFIGKLKINIYGTGRFSRNTDLGQPVPVITQGSKVVIRRPDGAKVFSGLF